MKKITTPREAISALVEDGWYQKSNKATHVHFAHPSKIGKITVPINQRSLKKNISHNISVACGLKAGASGLMR